MRPRAPPQEADPMRPYPFGTYRSPTESRAVSGSDIELYGE